MLSVVVDRDKYKLAVLLYLLFGSIVIASARISPADAHPVSIGPRYFFFPYLISLWILVQLYEAAERKFVKYIGGGVILCAVINSFPVFSRGHVDLVWASHVLSCREFPKYNIPVEYDGTQVGLFYLPLRGERCAELINSDFFFRGLNSDKLRTFPYSYDTGICSGVGAGRLVLDNMRGGDFSKSTFGGLVVVGSHRVSDSDKGEALIRMRRGDKILYRSGPNAIDQHVYIVGQEHRYIDTLPVSIEWATLDFSNRTLPDEFTVRFVDNGSGWGEWSAVAIRSNAH